MKLGSDSLKQIKKVYVLTQIIKLLMNQSYSGKNGWEWIWKGIQTPIWKQTINIYLLCFHTIL